MHIDEPSIEDEKEAEKATYEKINSILNIKQSIEIDEYFSLFCTNFSYLVDFVKTFKGSSRQMRVVLIDRHEKSLSHIQDEIGPSLMLIKNVDYDFIPYITHSFEEVQYFNGAHFKNVFMLFFTEYGKFEDNEKTILESLYKFETKLKILI